MHMNFLLIVNNWKNSLENDCCSFLLQFVFSPQTEDLKKNDRKLIPEISKRVPLIATQPAITCSKLTIEVLEQGVKYVQSYE